MGIKRKLQYLMETKEAIREALVSMEQDVPPETPFREYAEKIQNIGHHDTYDGEYDVSPSVAKQTLLTKDKVMSDNVTIESMSLLSKTITANGEYIAASDDADGYYLATVIVPNTYDAQDEGKVVSDGELIGQTGLSITENGTYDTTFNNQVEVDIPQPSLLSKTISQNGTYKASDDNADGYSEVTVGVNDASIPIGGETGAFFNSMITNIREFAFYHCEGLEKATFPNATTIGGSAFHTCKKLSEVSIPLCELIGTSAFFSCASLTEVSFPVCSAIQSSAFYSCSKLSKASFPSCKIIGSSAFFSCSSLGALSLPACTNIYSSAFQNCRNLSQLYLLGSSRVAIQSAYVFLNTPIYYSSYLGYFGSVYVPASLYSSYISAQYWSTLSSRIVSLTDEEIAAL